MAVDPKQKTVFQLVGVVVFMGAMAWASVPLYDGNRPLVEPAEPYLAFLKEQVAKARAEHADFKGEWVYFFITTKPR